MNTIFLRIFFHATLESFVCVCVCFQIFYYFVKSIELISAEIESGHTDGNLLSILEFLFI